MLSRHLGPRTLGRRKALEIAETTGVPGDLPSPNPEDGEWSDLEALNKGRQAPCKLVYRRTSGRLGFEAATHQVVEGGRDAPAKSDGLGPALHLLVAVFLFVGVER